jgi:tetratricopeptide (TPR) repeat protein
MMKFLRIYVLYRLQIIIALVIIGVALYMKVDKVSAILCFIFAFISLLLYFMMGTMRIVQEAVQDGDVDRAMQYIQKIKFPRLLFKPIRAAYYSLQSNLALSTDNLEKAEDNIRKSLKTKSSIVGDLQGTNMMQLGFIQLKQGKTKEARLSLIEAVKAGIPDKDSLAAVYLQLCSIEVQRNQNRAGKEYFKKAKALKPKSSEIVDQIKTMEKQISRIPG